MIASQRVLATAPLPQRADDWLGWLTTRIAVNSKPGQWDPELWLFTGDPDDAGSAVRRCQVAECDTILDKRKLCPPCERVFKGSGLALEEFVSTHRPSRQKRLPRIHGGELPRCLVEFEGERCPRAAVTHGVCQQHSLKWFRFEKRQPGTSFDDWLSTEKFDIAKHVNPECMVPGCDRGRRSLVSKLCIMHIERYELTDRYTPIEESARTAPVYVARFQFSLMHLSDELRCELLYAVQQRAARGGRIYPSAVRALVRVLEGKPSLATLAEPEMLALMSDNGASNVAAHLIEFRRTLRAAHDEFCGRGPHDRLIWDPVEIGLMVDPSSRGGTRRRGDIDFGLLSQSWLRELTMSWARDQTELRRVQDTHKAATVASSALRQRSDEGAVVGDSINATSSALSLP